MLMIGLFSNDMIILEILLLLNAFDFTLLVI